MSEGMPERAECYRRIGPFDRASLPAGLLAEHRLKAGVWALVSLEQGEVSFVWDDGRDSPVQHLRAGDSLVVPPEVLHHLEFEGDFKIGIAFHRQA